MLKRLKQRLESILKGVEEELEEREAEELTAEIKPEKEEEDSKREKAKKEGKRIPILQIELTESLLDNVLWQIELAMLENNVAEEAASHICESVKGKLVGRVVSRRDVGKLVKDAVRKEIERLFELQEIRIEDIIEKKKKEGKPALILFFGFNGAGKTTTMAKMAYMLLKKGYSVVFAAADTFRAASIEQLEEHARNLNIKVIKHRYGSDPAAVIFDAMKYAESKNIDVVLADTAGRSHADRNLLEELKKIVRVNKPDLRILVLEAIAGNDILEQARRFEEAGVDGVILTKWDVDERGGAAISAVYVLQKPILFVGTGQSYEDLEHFNKEKLLHEIVGR